MTFSLELLPNEIQQAIYYEVVKDEYRHYFLQRCSLSDSWALYRTSLRVRANLMKAIGLYCCEWDKLCMNYMLQDLLPRDDVLALEKKQARRLVKKWLQQG